MILHTLHETDILEDEAIMKWVEEQEKDSVYLKMKRVRKLILKNPQKKKKKNHTHE
jgi:hypothetical protein